MVDLTALALGASPALGAGLPTPPLRPTEGLKSLSRTGDLRSGITTWSGRPAPSAEYLLALLMIAAGVNHFFHPDFYDRIMPPYLPLHRELALLSGAIEIALGMLLLVPRLTRLAAWGIIALLIAVFPANIYLYQNQEILPAPPILHLLRLPMQGVFDPVGVVAYADISRVDQGRSDASGKINENDLLRFLTSLSSAVISSHCSRSARAT